jgi:anaerobic selenocysteine-containing dehydrogenase
MLNFGCNVYEAHVLHSSFVQRVVEGRVNNGAKLVTFDVRMSNTAGRSDEWFALKPGTDGIVALAMANVIMQEGLYDEKFITEWTNVTIDQLKNHLKQYTPEMAEKESGLPAKEIVRIAKEFATTKPATTISYRGACAHHNGLMNERSIVLLNVITGNVDIKGGFVLPQSGKAKDEPNPLPAKPKAKSGVKEYWKKKYPEASHGINQTVLPLIKEGVQKVGLYMTYWYNPVYSNPQSKLQEEVLKDEKLIPFFVAVDAYMGEGTALADIILPEASYLERWDPEANNSYSIIPWISIRQPIIKPLGESKSIRDIFMELAQRIGGGMETYFAYGSIEDYIRAAFKKNKGFEEDGGLEMLKKVGAWYDKSKKPAYKSYSKELKPEDLEGTKVDEKGYIFKEKQDGDKIVKEVVGIMKNGKALKGFPISKHKETPLLEVHSKALEEHGFPGLPSYIPIPEHRNMKQDDLILTTFKVAVHTQSRTANCKWLTEIYHSNPLWIHPETAQKRGIKNGDEVVVTSGVTSVKTKVLVTEGVHPKVVAYGMGVGHWAYGRIASKAAKYSSKGAGKDVNLKLGDPDTELIWWKDNGVHLNALVPVKPDPIGGGQAWMDTVVTVKKA